jgi:hypothetical protein
MVGAALARRLAFRLPAGFSSAEIPAEVQFDLTETWVDDAPARAALT